MHRIDKWSSRYSTVSFFLSILLAVSVAMILQRHVELTRALDDKANSTQLVLDLKTKWGEKQLTELAELKEYQTDHNKQLADMIVDEKERSVECTKHMKILQDKFADSLLKSSQILIEKEKCFHQFKTSQHSLIMCEDSLAACNEKIGGP